MFYYHSYKRLKYAIKSDMTNRDDIFLLKYLEKYSL